MNVRIAREPSGRLRIFGCLDQSQRQEEQDQTLAGQDAIYHVTEPRERPLYGSAAYF